MNSLREHIDNEVRRADNACRSGDLSAAFHRLERAHVLGQASTYQHTRIHWRMLKLGFAMRSPREIFGQVIRVIGAASKTPLGIYPTGNTGGANVWFFKPMPIPDDLQETLENAREG